MASTKRPTTAKKDIYYDDYYYEDYYYDDYDTGWGLDLWFNDWW